jgi:hypothetical protein
VNISCNLIDLKGGLVPSNALGGATPGVVVSLNGTLLTTVMLNQTAATAAITDSSTDSSTDNPADISADIVNRFVHIEILFTWGGAAGSNLTLEVRNDLRYSELLRAH